MTHSAYGQGYERLRRHAFEPGTPHDRQGLAVVAQRGIAAWLFLCAELPDRPAASPGQHDPRTLPAGMQTPLIDIVLAMLKTHMQREFA